MALFPMLRSQTVNDPVLGELTRTRGYWRGRIVLGHHRDVPLLIAGGRDAPEAAALTVARELTARYEEMQATIGPALLEHYEPYRDADQDEPSAGFPRIAKPADVWPHVTPVQVLVGSMGGPLGVEIGYATEWDVEHTLGAIIVDWRLVELNGSIRLQR